MTQDRNTLKIQALLEKITTLESEKADLRVDVTLLINQTEELQKRIKELESSNVSEEASETQNDTN